MLLYVKTNNVFSLECVLYVKTCDLKQKKLKVCCKGAANAAVCKDTHVTEQKQFFLAARDGDE